MIQWLHSQGAVWPAVLSVAGLLATASVAGRVLVRPRHWRHQGHALLVSLILGLDVIALLGLGSGCLGFVTPQSSRLALCLGTAACVWHCLRHREHLTRGARRRLLSPAVLVLGVATLVVLGPALCYPTGWDDLVYHIALPQRWLADGHPAVYLDLPYSAFPSGGEIIYWILMAAGGVIAPKLFVGVCWVLALVCLYRLLRVRTGPGAALVLTLAFGLARTVLTVAASAYVELLLVCNLAGMLLTLQGWKNGESRRNRYTLAVILGCLAGSAAGVKLTGVAMIAAPLLGIALQEWRRDRKRMLTALLLCLLTAFAVALPFYARSWVATGNPVYPYFCRFFRAEPAALAMSEFHHAIGKLKFGVKTVPVFFTAPILLGLDTGAFDGFFGYQQLPCLLLALAAVFAAARRRRSSRCILYAVLALALYVFWFFTAQQARFLIPVAFLTTLLAAHALRLISTRWRRATLVVVAAATLASLPFRVSGFFYYSWQAACGRLKTVDYLYTSTGEHYLPMVEAVFNHTPENAKLMLLFEHRLLYLPRRAVIGTPFFQEAVFTPPETVETPDAMLAALNAARVSHVLVGVEHVDPDRIPEYVDRWLGLIQHLGKLADRGQIAAVWRSKGFVLYEIMARSP